MRVIEAALEANRAWQQQQQAGDISDPAVSKEESRQIAIQNELRELDSGLKAGLWTRAAAERRRILEKQAIKLAASKSGKSSAFAPVSTSGFAGVVKAAMAANSATSNNNTASTGLLTRAVTAAVDIRDATASRPTSREAKALSRPASREASEPRLTSTAAAVKFFELKKQQSGVGQKLQLAKRRDAELNSRRQTQVRTAVTR